LYGNTHYYSLDVSPANHTWGAAGYSVDGSSSANDPTVYLNGDIKTVANGKLTQNEADSSWTSLSAASIGGRDALGRPSGGLYEDFAVWNQILTDDEFYALYMGESPINVRRESLVTYYPLDNIYDRLCAVSGATGLIISAQSHGVFYDRTHSDPLVQQRARARGLGRREYPYFGAAAGGTADTALSTAGAATATLVGAETTTATLSATGAAVGTLVTATNITAVLSSTGAAVGTLEGSAGAAVTTTDLSTAGAAVGTGVGARIAASVLMPHLGPEGQPSTSSAEFEGAALLAAHVSSTGAATGTLDGTVASNVVSSWLDTTGAATATATGASRVTSDLDADGAATATGATASIITANLSAAAAALGTLEAEAVSGYETADLSATGTAVGTMAGAAIIGAALSAAGAAVARLSTVEPSTGTAYLTWGAEARRVRQLQEEDDEEILTMLASMMPAIRRRHGKSYARPTIRTHR
jgi:hypothetical protein